MRKIIAGILLMFTTFMIMGCEYSIEDITSDNYDQMLEDTVETLRGDNSAVLTIKQEYSFNNETNEDIEFSIFINNKNNWQSFKVENLSVEDVRYVLQDNVDADLYHYYELNPVEQKYYHSSYNINELNNYIMMKTSLGNYSFDHFLVSTADLIEQSTYQYVERKTVTNNLDTSYTLDIIEITFPLNYFIDNDRTVLDSLYGYKVSSLDDLSPLKDIEQKMLIGFDSETQSIRAISYSQSEVMNAVLGNSNSQLDVTFFIQYLGEEAEELMQQIENSDSFPNENNIISNN